MSSKKPHGIKEYFVTGLFAVLPLALTISVSIWILRLLWEKFFSLLVLAGEAILRISFSPEVASQLRERHVHEAIGFLLLLAIIIFVGFVSRRFIGKSLLRLMEQIIHAIPGFNFIYATIRQFTSTMDPASPQRDAFRQAVLVRVAGGYMLGFLTSHSELAKGPKKRFATVFIPCNQLIQGYNLLVEEKDLMPLDMNVDDAFKYVISFGMVAPHILKPSKQLRKK
jgi:uncharacterized membrane protein